MNDAELSTALRLGRRTLDSVYGCCILEDFRWYDDVASWVLLLELKLEKEIQATELVPESSNWYVVVQREYPRGRISVLPAKSGGIPWTFPHQSYNGQSRDERPWRRGRLCLDVPSLVSRAAGASHEPLSAEFRLAWHIERALEWLALACRGELLDAGAKYELPDFDADRARVHLIHAESTASFAAWRERYGSCGTTILRTVNHGARSFQVACEFSSFSGNTIIHSSWGDVLSSSLERATRRRGAWILLPEAPICPPWQAPQTWGDLSAAARFIGVDMDKLVDKALRPLVGAENPILLVGFPIPDIVGGEPVEIHWQPVRLPRIPTARQLRLHRLGRRGRSRARGKPISERIGIRDSSPIQWGISENWTPERLQARGRFCQRVRGQTAAVIGVGALGSVVTELLVRGGVESLVLVDGDKFEAGNLVRHTLGLSDLGVNKAAAVARRIREASPHVTVKVVEGYVRGDAQVASGVLKGVDVVVDCTADDEILNMLEDLDTSQKRRWISASVGYRSRRLFMFAVDAPAFPARRYRQFVRPWIEEEGRHEGESAHSREGPGCWHPLFPARYDAITLMASIAVSELEALGTTPLEHPKFVVFEATVDEKGALQGVRRYTDTCHLGLPA